MFRSISQLQPYTFFFFLFPLVFLFLLLSSLHRLIGSGVPVVMMWEGKFTLSDVTKGRGGRGGKSGREMSKEGGRGKGMDGMLGRGEEEDDALWYMQFSFGNIFSYTFFFSRIHFLVSRRVKNRKGGGVWGRGLRGGGGGRGGYQSEAEHQTPLL